MQKTSARRQVLLILGLCTLGLVAWVALFLVYAYDSFQRAGISFDDLRDLFSGRGGGSRLVGKVAPDFELATLDGGTIRLSDHVGKEVILLNFFATWCGPCKREMPELVAFAETRRDRPFLLIGVDADESRSDVEAFLREFHVTYPVGIDSSTIASTYRVTGYPSTVLIGADGRIKQYRLGAVEDAEAIFGADLDANLAIVESGRGISKEEYLALYAAEGYDADDASVARLSGRARDIASVMTCPCGCESRVIDCGCDTAKRIRASLARGEDFALSDEELIERLNARFCVGAGLPKESE